MELKDLELFCSDCPTIRDLFLKAKKMEVVIRLKESYSSDLCFEVVKAKDDYALITIFNKDEPSKFGEIHPYSSPINYDFFKIRDFKTRD